MVIVQICIGSSCHLRGAPEIVDLLQKAVKDNSLEDHIALTGSFCTGNCNRTGVTVCVNDDVHTSVTPASFETFWRDVVLPAVEKDKE